MQAAVVNLAQPMLLSLIASSRGVNRFWARTEVESDNAEVNAMRGPASPIS
jgi:hypothetical protein